MEDRLQVGNLEDGVLADPVRSAGRAAALAHRALLDDQGLPARIVQPHRARVLHLETWNVPLPDNRQGPGVDLRHVRPGILVGPVQARLEMPGQGGRPYQTAPYAGLREGHGHGVGEPVLPGIEGVLNQLSHELRYGGIAEVGAGWIVDVVNATIAWRKPPLESSHSRHLSHHGTDTTVRILRQRCHGPRRRDRSPTVPTGSGRQLPRLWGQPRHRRGLGMAKAGARGCRQRGAVGQERKGHGGACVRQQGERGRRTRHPLTCNTDGCSTDGKPAPGHCFSFVDAWSEVDPPGTGGDGNG